MSVWAETIDWPWNQQEHLVQDLTIFGPTRTLKIQCFDNKLQDFGSTKVEVVGPALPALW